MKNQSNLMCKIGLGISIFAQSVATLGTLTPMVILSLSTPFLKVAIYLLIAAMYCIIALTISSMALSNLNKFEKGEVKFKHGLMLTAGIFAFFTSLLPSILIFLGVSDVCGEISQKNKKDDEYNKREIETKEVNKEINKDEIKHNKNKKSFWNSNDKQINFYKGSLIFAIAFQVLILLVSISFGTVSFGIYFGLSIAPIVVTSFALNNLIKTERDETKFNRDLAIASGILCLLVSILAGILILVSFNQASEQLVSKTKSKNTSPNEEKD